MNPLSDRNTVARALDVTTVILAVWGALLSTVAIVRNIRRDLLDRGKLKVVCYRGRPPRDRRHEHRRGKDEADTLLEQHPRSDARTFQPGEYFVEYRSLSVLDEQPRALWATDSLGRYWKIRRRDLRRLLEEQDSERGWQSRCFTGDRPHGNGFDRPASWPGRAFRPPPS